MVVVLISLLLLFLTLYRWWNKRAVGASPVKRTWGRALIIIGAAIGTVLALAFCSKYVGISGPLLMGLNFSMEVVAMILFARAALLLGSALGKTIVASPKIDPRGINAGLINASCAFISFIAAGFIVIYGLSNLGVSLIPLLTGLGVGGLAVALAARPTLENLIGGFMILLDKPYRIGQRVMVKGYDGNVEKVGWRSTQVRLRSGPQVTIPNEEMARLDIENIDRRPFIRRKTNITITYGTPPEKIEKAVQIIQGILDNHEGMDPDWPPWVFFDEFNADSLNIVVYYWYHPPDLHKFLSFSQQINLQIFRAFEKEEIAFAFPTTTSYLTQEDGQRLKVDIANPI
jgi:MscS family membrane protein